MFFDANHARFSDDVCCANASNFEVLWYFSFLFVLYFCFPCVRASGSAIALISGINIRDINSRLININLTEIKEEGAITTKIGIDNCFRKDGYKLECGATTETPANTRDHNDCVYDNCLNNVFEYEL